MVCVCVDGVCIHVCCVCVWMACVCMCVWCVYNCVCVCVWCAMCMCVCVYVVCVCMKYVSVLYFVGTSFRGKRQKLVLRIFFAVFIFADGYVGLVPRHDKPNFRSF